MEEKMEPSNKKQKTEYLEYDEKLNCLFDLFNSLHKNLKNNPQCKSIEENIEFLKKKQKDIKRDRYTIFFFGKAGGGKSYLINFLISGNKKYPLPSGGQDGHGLTRVPVKICFSSVETITVTKYQKSSEFFSIELTFEQSTDYLSKYIQNLNEDDSLKYITIQYPEKLIFEKHRFIKNFELIDLMGIEPDDKSKDINLNTNKTFVDTFESIDGIFYVSQREGRGKIGEQDIEKMYDCGLFQKCSKFSSPKIVSISLSDFDIQSNESDSSNKESLYSIYEALAKVFNYNINRLELTNKKEILEKISLPKEKKEFFIVAKMHSVGKMIENCKRIKIFKCESGQGMRKCSINSFNDEILDNIKDLKKKCTFFQLINEAYSIVFTLGTILSSREKREKINAKEKRMKTDQRNKIDEKETKKKVFNEMYEFLYVDKDGFKKQLKITIENIAKDLNNFESEIKEHLSFIDVFFVNVDINLDKKYEIFMNTSPILNEKMVNLIKSVQSKIIKIVNDDDKEKLELENYFEGMKKLAKDLIDLSNDNQIKTILKETPINSIKKAIEKELRTFLEGIPWLIIEELTDSPEIQLKASIKHEIEELKDYFKNKQYDLNKEIYGSFKTNNFVDNSQHPIRFESNNTTKIPSFVDKQNNGIHKGIETIIDTLKEKLFINKSLRSTTKDNIIKKTNELFSNLIENNLKLKLDVLEKENKLVDVENEKRCNEIQIYLDKNQQEIVAKCNYKAIYDDLKDLNEKIKEFRLEFLKKNDYQDETTSLEPIFVWSDLKHFKNIFILQELKSKLDAKNFRFFLFLEINDWKVKSELKKEIGNFCQDINSITFVFINKNDLMKETKTLGKARILKIMFLVAELFQIENFFYIGQNVSEFQEFNSEKHIKGPNSCIRALSFMSKTMFRVLNNTDNKNKNCAKLTDFLSKEEIKKMKSFIMKGFWSSIEYKEVCENLKFKIYENLNGSNEDVENQHIVFSIQNLKIKEHILNYEEKNNSNEKYSDIFEKYFQFLNAPNMTTVGQISLKKINGKEYEKFINRLIGVSRETHCVCKDQESDVIYYNMNAIKKLHPVHDKFFFDSTFVLDEKQLINEYYYYKMVHFVTNVLLYHFTYDTKDISTDSDIETDDDFD